MVGLRVVLNDVSQGEVDKLVQNLCCSIKAGDVIVTELHNYSKNSKKYLSEKNIADIRKACAECHSEVVWQSACYGNPSPVKGQEMACSWNHWEG